MNNKFTMFVNNVILLFNILIYFSLNDITIGMEYGVWEISYLRARVKMQLHSELYIYSDKVNIQFKGKLHLYLARVNIQFI